MLLPPQMLPVLAQTLLLLAQMLLVLAQTLLLLAQMLVVLAQMLLVLAQMLLLMAQVLLLLLASQQLLLLHSMGCLQPVYTQPQVPPSAERPSSKPHDRTAEHPTLAHCCQRHMKQP